jgi:transcriptional regulator with XRE-family HTH domain
MVKIVTMPRKTQLPLPSVQRALAGLGENLMLARKRRGLAAVLVAERAGMSRPTLRALERGDPGCTLGALANLLNTLGLEHELEAIARQDPLGRTLQDAEMVAPRKRTRRVEPRG